MSNYCLQCGKEIPPKDKSRHGPQPKFCPNNRRCYSNWYKKGKYAPRTRIRICLVCNKVFQPNNQRHVYCDSPCREYALNHAEYKLTNRQKIKLKQIREGTNACAR